MANLLLALVTVLVTLALAEAALWIVAPVRYHEWLIWEAEGHIRARPVPGQVIHTAEGHPVRINRYGFRGPDYQEAKPAGTLRVEVLGGSAGFCFHAAGREKSWPGALEKELTERLDLPVEVVNLSLPGFDSFRSKFNYQCYGRMFQPDVVIVYHTWNDMKRYRKLETTYYRPASGVPNKPLWQRIARRTQIGRRSRNLLWSMTGRELEGRSRSIEGSGRDADRPVSDVAWSWERQNFSDIVTLARNDGVLPVLVSQATLVVPDNLDNEEVRRAAIPTVFSSARLSMRVAADAWIRVTSILEELAEEYDIPFVDGYRAVPHDLVHLRDHVHLRDVGSAVLAEAIADRLLSDARFLGVVERVRAGESRTVPPRDTGSASP